MRPLVAALLALLLVPAGAAAKNPDAPVRVLWNSTPDGVQAGGTWDARLSLLRGPGGFGGEQVRPRIVVTELASRAERRVPMTVDVPPSTFKASVSFPRAGFYSVAVTGFDPRHPARLAKLGPPVGIEPAPTQAAATGRAGGASWLWFLLAGATLAALLAGTWSIRRPASPTP
jgi:hypothetical protein